MSTSDARTGAATTAPDGEGSKAPRPTMSALEAELAATRQELTATIDALSDRLDPRVRAAAVMDQGRTLLRDAMGTDPAADRERRGRARAVVGAVAAGAALLLTAALRRR